MVKKRLLYILKIPFYFIAGIVFSMPYIGGTFAPFASSFPSACDGIYMLAASLGSVTGIFVFHSGLTAFRYFAILITSVSTLRIAVSGFKFEKENTIRIICPGICCFAVNFVFLLSQKSSADLFLSVIIESVLCSASVPVFREALVQIKDKTLFNNIENREKDFICFALFASIFSAQLRSTGEIGEWVCLFLLFFTVLLFSQVKNLYGGIITGICSSFVFALNGEADFTCAMFSLCGCICAFLSKDKKILKILTAVICSVAGCALGEYTDFIPIVPCAALAGIVFFFIPDSFFSTAEKKSAANNKSVSFDSVKSNEIALAVENISDCVEAVRKTISPLVAPELKDELIRARENICGKCEIYDSCINEIKKNDNPCFQKIANAFNSGEPDFACFPDNFVLTCYNCDDMLAEMKKAYFIHCENVNSGNKINRMQALTGQQFKTFGSVIGQACNTVSGIPRADSGYNSEAALCLKKFGVEAENSLLCTDKAGRIFFDLSFRKPKNNFSVTALTEKIQCDTGYELEFPTLVQNGNIYDLIFKQKELLSFNISAAVKPCTGKNVCGDYYRCFKDYFGRQTVLLSDGMGTGSRAAIDSAFTCETFTNLIKSGLDEKAAVAAVNCAMMIKSTDESLATVDYLRLDPVLQTGEIFKCGAAPSFILHKKKISVIETESTPIGILDNVDMSRSHFEIAPGDVIILVSDGVADEKYNWIYNEIKAVSKNNPSKIAKHILQCASDRKIGKHHDDMTVIAVCVAEKE